MNNEIKFLPIRKTGALPFAVLRMTKDAFLDAIQGGTVDAGLLCYRQMDESRKEFQTRCERELGLPKDSPIWGEAEKGE